VSILNLPSYRLRLFIIPCLICIITGLVGTIILESELKEWMTKQFERELLWQARNSSQLLHSLNISTLNIISVDEITDRLGNQTPTRFTIIDQDGTVLGDSKLRYEEVLVVANHADRPEIVDAFKEGKGVSERYSHTLKSNMLYVSVLHLQGKHPLVIRTALPLSDIENNILKIRGTLAFIALVTLAIIIGLAWFMSRLGSRSIEQEHLKLERRVTERTREISLLQELSNLLATSGSVDEAKLIVSNISRRLFSCNTGALSLIKSSKNLSEVIASWGDDWPGDDVFHSNACWALRKGQPHLFQKQGINIMCEHFEPVISIANSLCIPMVAHGETIGAFHLIKQEENFFTEQEIELAYALARQVSMAIANLKLRQLLENQAVRDALTGLYNRRYLDDVLERELRRGTRHKTGFSVLMMDVDYFKQLNDNYGHDCGDYVLKVIASVFQKCTRHEDVCCRYGGEEFMIVLSESTIEGAIMRAEYIREEISNTHFVNNAVALSQVTLSIGIACFPEHAMSVSDLIKAADNALYQAKQRGRNQVVITEETV